MRDDFNEALTQPAKFFTQTATQLLRGGAQRQVGLRPNQINNGFRLGEIDFAIEIGALSKFTGLGRTRAGFEAHTRIDRREWGLRRNQALETGGILVGNELKVELDVQAVLQAGAGKQAAA